jgi:hypothetical protein
MRQLVGLPCAICEKAVGSIVDAHFCTACGCPVHNKCVQSNRGTIGSGCSLCGAKPEYVQRELAATKDVPGQIASKGPGLFATYQIVRYIIGGVACGFFGIGMLVWEVSEASPSFWAIVRSIFISIFGFILAGILILRSGSR